MLQSQFYQSFSLEPHSLCQHDELAGQPGESTKLRLLRGQKEESWEEPLWAPRLHVAYPTGQARRTARGKVAGQDSWNLHPNSPQANSAAGVGGVFALPSFQFLNLQNRQ